MKSQLWTIDPIPGGLCNVIDENGAVLASMVRPEGAHKIIANRAAAVAAAAWIFGGTYENVRHPHMNVVQPVIEHALGPQKKKDG